MKSKKRVSRKKRKTKTVYTRGELNKLIDAACHPLIEKNSGFILVDGVLHALVEQDTRVTVRKFVGYNLPKVLKQLSERNDIG